MTSLEGRFGDYRCPPSFTARDERDAFADETRFERSVKLVTPDALHLLWRRRPHEDPDFHDASFRCHVGLKFALYNARCATYVRLERGRVACIASLVNDKYANGWQLGAADDALGLRTANIPPGAWWRNGPLLCNQLDPALWSDGYLPQLWEMIQRAAEHYRLGPCEFLLNKRDAPLLAGDMFVTPAFRRQVGRLLPGLPASCLSSAEFKSEADGAGENLPMLPVLSQYVDPVEQSDIHIPTVAEYELATGRFYLHGGRSPPLVGAGKPLGERRPTAFFRGSATGYGVTPDSNPRLGLVERSYRWSRDARRRHKLDARLTGLNRRPKFQPDGTLAELDPTCLPPACVQKVYRNRVTYETMQTYRYLLYVDGNSGADRLAAYLASGSVVLIVEPRAPPVQLLQHLTPWVHYVPIRWDLEDLEARIDWCRANPRGCVRLVAEARRAYQAHCTEAAILERVAAAIRRATNQDGRILLRR